MVRWVFIVCLVAGQWLSALGLEEICSGDSFQATCRPGEVVVMDKAEYGRMEAGPCRVTEGGGDIGCRNDILFLLDQKCSGRQECTFLVGGNEFYDSLKECNKELLGYLRVSYSCIKVELKTRSECLIPKKLPLPPQEGFIASHVTDDTGCGTSRFPWSIEAMPGQTINLTLLDFGALSRTGHHTRCEAKYGFIVERSVSANVTICGSPRRESKLYSSNTHNLQINLIEKERRNDHSFFLIRYRVIGCSDLTPPGNAYFERKGNEAVIGCSGTDITWRLLCNGNTWDGVVGNCTAKSKLAAVVNKPVDVPMKSVLVVAAIVGATVVIAVLIVVSGVVYIKRYRHSQDLRANTMQYTLHYTPKGGQPSQLPRGGTYRPMACAHARPEIPSASRAPTLAKPRRPPPSTGTGKPLQHIWEMPLPDPHAKKETPSESIYMNPTECTCSTATKTRPTEANVANGDDISSFYEPNTGHKYYVLERQDQMSSQQLPPPPSQQQLQQIQQQAQQQLLQPEQ